MDETKKALLGPTQPICNAPMGIGELGSPLVVLVRQFRWTLRGLLLNEFFVRKVHFDFKNKKMNIEAMEAVCNGQDINIHQWLEADLSREILDFTTYDGCGVPLYTHTFSGLEVIEDSADFDYASSEVSIRKVSLLYKKVERKFHSKHKKLESEHQLTILADKALGPYSITMSNRPSLTMEETVINRNNASMYIPGKAHWNYLDIEFYKESRAILSAFDKHRTVRIDVFDDGKPLETWTLHDTWIAKMNNEEEMTKLTLRYGSVEYLPTENHENRNG